MTSWIVTIPNHLKIQEMCNEAVCINSLSLAYVPGCFKTQEICNEAVKNKLCMLLFVPNRFWTQGMCNEIMRTIPDAFHCISDCFKTQEMCDKAVKNDSSSLEYVPDWFVTREGMWMWYDDYYEDDGDHWDNDVNKDKFFDWYEDYQKRQCQKAKIKEKLLPIAWHPSKYWDWCVLEDKKQGIKKLWRKV